MWTKDPNPDFFTGSGSATLYQYSLADLFDPMKQSLISAVKEKSFKFFPSNCQRKCFRSPKDIGLFNLNFFLTLHYPPKTPQRLKSERLICVFHSDILAKSLLFLHILCADKLVNLQTTSKNGSGYFRRIKTTIAQTKCREKKN